jgi:fatty-acyl-CoA synthase
LAEALDYAATGDTGCNFYSARGELEAVVPYSLLRTQAKTLAKRIVGLGLERGSRLVLVAETNPDFLRFFFACQYAGMVPVPVPVPMSLGSHQAYVDLLRGMIKSCHAAAAVAPPEYLTFLKEAADGLGLAFRGAPGDYEDLPDTDATLSPSRSEELAYLQYTSGSTRFPRGVMITQATVLSNLAGIITDGVKLREGDRCVSWLPFYHDMGLVGLVLGPVASQTSVDYLGTRDFSMRPRQWLSLISRTRATVSFSPPFGFELCARRLRPGEAADLDLSSWRVAGVGAEMIHPEVLERFAKVVRPSGFDPKAFVPCYGMAECSLAVSFAPLERGITMDRVDTDRLAQEGLAVAVDDDTGRAERVSAFVNCGTPLADYEVQVRDEEGHPLPDRHTGTIFLRGPSVMSGYFRDPEATRSTLSADGWLDTGDIGYRVAGNIFVTGRRKDMIIINGRNIWPQDIEYLAQQQPEVRSGDCLAFSAPGPDGEEMTVVLVQCRETDPAARSDLVRRVKSLVYAELGIDCHVELAPLHTLPRTSSGKLSRSKAQQNFIAQRRSDAIDAPREQTLRQMPGKRSVG